MPFLGWPRHLDLRQQHLHHLLEQARIAPRHGMPGRRSALVAPIHEHRVQRPVEIVALAQARRFDRPDRPQHLTRPTPQAGSAQSPGEADDVGERPSGAAGSGAAGGSDIASMPTAFDFPVPWGGAASHAAEWGKPKGGALKTSDRGSAGARPMSSPPAQGPPPRKTREADDFGDHAQPSGSAAMSAFTLRRLSAASCPAALNVVPILSRMPSVSLMVRVEVELLFSLTARSPSRSIWRPRRLEQVEPAAPERSPRPGATAACRRRGPDCENCSFALKSG